MELTMILAFLNSLPSKFKNSILRFPIMKNGVATLYTSTIQEFLVFHNARLKKIQTYFLDPKIYVRSPNSLLAD